MFVCLNSGLESSSNLEKVMILTARFCNINGELMLVGYVLPYTTSPYVGNGYQLVSFDKNTDTSIFFRD